MLDLHPTPAPTSNDASSEETVADHPPAPEPAGPPSGRTRLWNWFVDLPPEAFVSLFVVGCCVVFVWSQVSQGSVLGNVVAENTPSGGDMGAHVWGPAFLRDHLLPQGRLAGWTPDWYAGFPAYQFYMVLPSLAIALLSFVLPYGVAFKLVTVSGVLTLPIAAWAFGKLSDTPFPGPPLFAVGATMFLFDRGFSIYGGNIPSTLAGEFAFSISLSFAVLYLGFLSKALRTGRCRGWAAVTLALVGLNHLIPLIFVVVCTFVMLVVYPAWRARRFALAGIPVLVGSLLLAWVARGPEGDFSHVADTDLNLPLAVSVVLFLGFGAAAAGWSRFKVWFPVLAVGGLLMAFWFVPFYLQHKYMNDMGWEKKTDYANMLYSRLKLDPQLVDSPKISWIMLGAAAGALLSLIWGRRSGIFLTCVAVVFAVAFVLTPQARLWNARLLPFYYLSLYLLAALGLAEIGRLLSLLVARDVMRPVRSITAVTALAGLTVGIGMVALPLRSMVGGSLDPATGVYYWPRNDVPGVGGLFATKESSFISSWARWNYTGYEGKEAYPEYYGITQTMAGLGRQNGCGRAMWEHEEQHDRFGTPMALMLLPFWTDGCIGSMEGLYFEASATTPYHFLNQDQLSTGPSNAQRDLPYGPGPPSEADFDLGVKHLQMLGVKYYMAISEGMATLGRKHSDLSVAATYGPWVVFEVGGDNQLVAPLAYQPAVLEGVTGGGESWLKPTVTWYQNPEAWDVTLTDAGPSNWQRVTTGEGPGLLPLDPVEVSNVRTSNDRIEFDVDRVGVPVVVRSSYFPNWQASGADGPWRATPNLMVVVPTENHVVLSYGYTRIDYLAWALFLIGVAGAVVLFRRPGVVMPPTWAERSERKRRERVEAYTEAHGPPPGDGADGFSTATWAAGNGPPLIDPWLASLAHDDPAHTLGDDVDGTDAWAALGDAPTDETTEPTAGRERLDQPFAPAAYEPLFPAEPTPEPPPESSSAPSSEP